MPAKKGKKKTLENLRLSSVQFLTTYGCNYSATFVESQVAWLWSQQAVESVAALVSTATESALSAVALLAALLPHDANEIAANAANANTNFFIFLPF
jgi:hypothetical protein